MSRIVAVHGVNQYDPTRGADAAADRLGAAWARALSHPLPRPLDDGELSMTYYADLLQAARPDQDGQGPGDDMDRLAPEAVDAVLRWGELLGVSTREAQGRVYTPARWIADGVAKRRGFDQELVRRFVARFFPDLLAYQHTPAGTRVRQRLADAIARQEPRVLIAHSLGSVVAYDTLWQYTDLKVDVLVTIGSPLAMPDVVLPYLEHPDDSRAFSRPPGAAAWVNIADPGDLVAVPQPLTDTFRGVAACLSTGIGAFRMHKAGGYLRSAATAKAVLPYLEPSV
ncbi:hypothetical protein GCM10010313_07500 [Streptomyces violarus]|uniref:Serine peptidase n=1 Tax=Streptomyces violarus TaxID=67380 RepID=A0A7W5EZF4_9ACTN|nr:MULTISPECIES: hypothetical protein [Streptomyces]MBB3074284.1 hypothetical protein [Streptomyces violarus]WRT96995.1 hypothetical protein VJ737_04500 [Streptomyces sp. CGMCC 4.1772]GHC98531.1 hypothetical protein GCM10010313_07500 [Streptomyces violarus]